MAVVLSVALIGMALSFSVFGAVITSRTEFPIFRYYDSSNTELSSDHNIYSITQVGTSQNSLLTSGTDYFTVDGARHFLVVLPLKDLGLVAGVSYRFQITAQSRIYNNVDTTIQAWDINFIDNSGNATFTNSIDGGVTYASQDFTYLIPNGVKYIAFGFDLSVPSGNRARLTLSQLVVDPLNNADIGGSFSDDQPDIPDVDIDTYLDDFGNVTPDAINTLVNGFGQVSGSVQATAMFFSKVWTDLTTAAPEVMYVIYFGLSFGVIALILNIYSFAKGQGRAGQASSTGRNKGGSPK